MTIFENLVYNENTFTELFKNLMRYKVFRKLFLELIDSNLLNQDIQFEDFSTQKSTENGRPDLVISTDEVEIFIEIKVYDTTLTPNQPNGYLLELEKKDGKTMKQLVLLTPREYKYLEEYNNRKKEYQSVINSKTIYWESIIKKVVEEEIHESNPILTEYLNLLKEWFEAPKIFINYQFTQFMNDKYLPRNLEKLTSIIDQLKVNLQRSGLKITNSKKKILDEYGFYCDSDGYLLFIGDWFEYWKYSGNPLCIALRTEDENIIKRYTKAVQGQSFSDVQKFYKPEWYCSSIHLNLDQGEVNIEELSSNIKMVIKAISEFS